MLTKLLKPTTLLTSLAFVSCYPAFAENSAASIKQKQHDHTPVVVPAHLPRPALQLQLHEDAMSGYNLHLHTQNYRFVPPELANDEAALKLLEGHAHLYINGRKIGRLYSHYQHLPGKWFKPGRNQITVSLNSHQHQDWVWQGETLLGSVIIDHGGKTLILHERWVLPMTN